MWGLQPWLPYNTSVRPAWYVFSAMSRYLRDPIHVFDPASVVNTTVSSAGDVAATAVSFTSGLRYNTTIHTTVMLVNMHSDVAVDVDVVFNPPLPAERMFFKHLYDPSAVPTDNNILPTSLNISVSTSIEDSLPPGGVVIYTTMDD